MVTEEKVLDISREKKEPKWMRNRRLAALGEFNQLPMPKGVDLDLEKVIFYLTSPTKKTKSWRQLPEKIRKTYDDIGVPVWERNFLAGVEAQWDSSSIYGSLLSVWENQGVIFTDTDTALKKHPKIFEKYFGKLVTAADNKFAALNTAFWSGGSLIYVPKNVEVVMPLQAYFRINARNFGQFERTLIIVEKEAKVTYIEGCSAPIYTDNILHAGVVEVFVGEGATVEYITTQNWSESVFNLVTKRARVEKNGTMRWLDANLGSKLTMKYPSCYLEGEKARGEMVSLAIAGPGQCQDTGAKMFHRAKGTTSTITSKSVAYGGGKTIFRGMVKVDGEAKEAKSKTKCESLILDKGSAAENYPAVRVETPEAAVTHEAVVSKLEEEQLFYLQNRGLTKEEAEGLIVNGFIDSIISQLPAEYGLEIKRLMELIREK